MLDRFLWHLDGDDIGRLPEDRRRGREQCLCRSVRIGGHLRRRRWLRLLEREEFGTIRQEVPDDDGVLTNLCNLGDVASTMTPTSSRGSADRGSGSADCGCETGRGAAGEDCSGAPSASGPPGW